MLKTVTALTLAVATVFGAMTTTVDQAEAGRGGRIAAGVAAGIIGLGILGAYAHARDRHHYRSSSCYKGPERCSWRGRHCFENRHGDVVCRGGNYSCHRETICD